MKLIIEYKKDINIEILNNMLLLIVDNLNSGIKVDLCVSEIERAYIEDD